MSTIINRAQNNYRISLIVEFFFLLCIFFILFFYNKILGYSFLLGCFSAFLPYCLFVYLTLFIKRLPNKQLKVFYLAEAVKFGLTSSLIIFTLVYIKVNIIIFFAGYFLSILLNNILPFMVNKNRKVHFK